MIRVGDAFVLAYTKLRVHKIRTGVAVGVAGMLFGLIAAVIIIAQGIFSSVDSFSDQGLNNRTILTITRSPQSLTFNEYDHRDDPAFIIEVEAAHKELVAKKTAAAKKYGIPYDATTEDPSPVIIDPQTKNKVIKDSALSESIVLSLGNAKRTAAHKPFDIEAYVSKFSSAKIIQEYKEVKPAEGELVYMKDGKEAYTQESRMAMYNANPPTLTVLDASLSKPFISNTSYDSTKGEIPVIIPYSAAEKLLGYKKLDGGAPMQEKLDRLNDVRSRIGEVTTTYCYRNNASSALLARALAQKEEMKVGAAADKNYVKPAVIYTVPEDTTCGAVTIATDTRTAAQKKQDSQYVLYEKEIGTYIGEPQQQLVTVRGVGIASEVGSTGVSSIADMTQSLFSSWLGYGTWTIPADLLAQVPADMRPDVIFNPGVKTTQTNQFAFFMPETYLVEFGDKEDARTLVRGSGLFGGSMSGETFAYPFGSGVLIVDELKTMFETALMWVFIVIGSIAVVILASIIGRTVSEGRRESSIFRAIGASRLDIGSIYGTYVLLLSLRIMLFALVLGAIFALVLEVLFWQEATLGARLAYAANDVTKEFHFFNLGSPYLLWIAVVILIASVIASIIPILLGARRNPIKDMRNDA